jgi:hypothetical protein
MRVTSTSGITPSQETIQSVIPANGHRRALTVCPTMRCMIPPSKQRSTGDAMKAIVRALCGVRDDLALSERWWHRLAQVLLIGTTAFVGIAAWIISGAESRPEAREGNIKYINLQDYREAQNKDATDIVDHFIALPGTLALLQDDGSTTLLYPSELKADLFCSQDIWAHTSEYIKWKTDHHSPTDPEETVETAAADFRRIGIKPGEASCVGPESAKITKVGRAIKWAFTGKTVAKWEAKTAVIGLIAAFVWVVIACNVYYRGLIFVVFGRRKKDSDQALAT